MSIKIIRERSVEHEVIYRRVYDWADAPGSGFSFACDEEGHVLTSVLEPLAYENLLKCQQASPDEIVDKGVVKYERDIKIDAIGECYCGAHVYLDGFTNPCPDCNRDYNWRGDLLAPRSQWGEETGEHPADIARIP